ncbi:MAG: phosphoribosyl-ATP diphosphatase [Acidiphilium sp.]
MAKKTTLIATGKPVKAKPKPTKPKALKRSKAPKAPKPKVLKAKGAKSLIQPPVTLPPVPPLNPDAPDARVLDRLWSIVLSRKSADPLISHSARLLARGVAKIAQKFGEEAVECLIEAVSGNREALIAESADVLYHMMVMWVGCGLRPDDVWAELERREGISGIAEKAARRVPVAIAETRKIP